MIIKRTKDIKIFNSLNRIYHIREQLIKVSRKKDKQTRIKGSTVAKLLFTGMFFREKSINQIMEKTHKRKKYKRLFSKEEKIPKMHGFRDVIKEINPEQLKQINNNVIKKSKENKIYRQGTIDGLVVVEIDGTEAFGSYKKKWNNCYNKNIKNKKYIENKEQIVEEEYHERIDVFAKVVGKRPGIILGYETVTSNGRSGKQEYEPDVGKKLVKKLSKSYGSGIDVIVGDALYLKRDFLEVLKDNRYVGVFRLKDNNKALLADAEGVFKIKASKKYKEKGKEIEYWSDKFEYKSNIIKVAKYIEKDKKGMKNTIYVVCTDLGMNEKTLNRIIHARWEIENNGFNELKKQWNMKHCYIADENAINVIMQMIILSYNLWELYIYGHLHNFEEKKMTKSGFIEEIEEIFFRNKCKAWHYESG